MPDEVTEFLLAKLPGVGGSAVRGFKHNTPVTMQKASKRQRELSEDPGSQGSDDEGLCEVDVSATKKPKIPADEHITVHPIILKPRPATLKARKQMKQAYDELVQSPFFMGPTTTMDDMHDLLAVRLRTAVANLDTDRLQWRFEKPKNAPLKPLLVDLDGFSAMMRAVAGKRGPDRIINLYLPPLKAEASENDENIDAYPQISLLHAQKASIDKSSEPTVRLLEDKYPVGNSALFPSKRVYEKDGRAWELNPLRLQVWAIAILDGRATLDAPPTPNHFDIDKCLRSEPSAPMMPSPHAAMPLFPGFGMHPGTQLPLMPGYPFLPGYPFPFYGAPHAPPPAVPGELSLPPSVASITTQIIPLPRPISIAEFCTYYKIPDSDRDKLVSLEIELGDRRCEQLGEDEWKGDGKFTKLAWDRFKEKHARFCTDIANGLWDVTEN